MSDTPETDAAWKEGNAIRELTCRKLDRERDEARTRLEIITPHENNPVAEYFSSNTPETDALVLKKQPFGGTDYEWIELSRRLERDRNEAREAIHIAESLIKPQIEREQPTPEAGPDNDEKRDLTALLRLLREVRRERDSWEQTAAHYLDGMHYYRELVERVGETLGEAAYTQDDGGKVDSVLCAKVPELVVDLKRERDEARRHLEDIKEYGTEEINVAVELRQKLAAALLERDEARSLVDHYREQKDLLPISWDV